MTYAIGDKIRLTAARGGLTMFVSGLRGAPDGGLLYEVKGEGFADWMQGQSVVAEADIAEGPLEPPVFKVGQAVQLAGRGGIITAVNGDVYTVEVELVRQFYILTRQHTVPAWRLAIENPTGE